MRSQEVLVLARLVKYVKDTALTRITSVELRQQFTAHSNRLAKILSDAERQHKWKVLR